ncbi:MAG: transpeptidase-transglycosylase [Candidatus Rokuibacteriota bacterium]|nr:MAG: transpeptidase-transglycosylase [Candidatus Rokubacteria bacterium]
MKSVPVRTPGAFAKLVLIVATLGLAALAWGWWALALPRQATPPIAYLDADRQELASFQADGRFQIWVPLDRMPASVVAAVIAAEDRRFMRHHGVDILAVTRAALTNAREASVVRGASTITQQLARGLFLSRERTWWRKAREIGIALVLELRYSKREILEAYLNTVYLGQERNAAVLGVAAGARHLLGKRLETLRLDEAALLAAAIRAPNRVFGGPPDLIRSRRDRVLEAMVKEGAASEVDARAAMARPVRSAQAMVSSAPWFIELAREGVARRAVDKTEGARVVTSLDRRLQEAAEAAVRERLAQTGRSGRQAPTALQAAVVVMEPASGRIRALVGGRRFAQSEFNRATKARRQPGSLFKPLVYLAAFEVRAREITPSTVVADEPVVIPAVDGGWTPHNIDGRFHGPVTIRRALEDSLNVPAALVAQGVGLARVVRVARAVGIDSPLAAVPSLSLGTSEVTLLEMTTAFATIANGGVRVWPTTLDDAGAVALKSLPIPARVVSAESAFIVTHLMRGVMRRGTGGASARWGLQEVTAGKTGTTDGLRDAWFIGYTPDLVVGVWVGADDARPIGLTGADIALPIWADVMQKALRRSPPSPFTPPPGIVMTPVDWSTGRPACGDGDAIREAFREGSEPARCEGLVESPVAREFTEWIKSLFR